MAISNQMINSWKQLWFSEESIGRSLCLLGVALGLAVGIFCKDWAESFHSIGHSPHFMNDLIGYQIPSLISFGIAGGLTIQLVSVLLSWATLYQSAELYHTRIIEILLGVPIGVLIIFNIFSGYLVALGFVIPYVFALIFFPVVMIFVGWDTMHLLVFNAIFLMPLYMISAGIIWSVNFGRSIV
ncbi:hypothetical protein [Chamaesiphon sp. VAR_69_metabat_338]|uniref:hypothetical protein n=1 Tax=Chamaesiphon sp. VAR_69_metabat_338 TaxID=2964704 RepID=UPI00286DBA37|nr:hypothetical protein [Chamaesiphon sp. VAR_69_metabat_338]